MLSIVVIIAGNLCPPSCSLLCDYMEEVRMVRGKFVDGVFIQKGGENDEDYFSKSIQMFGGERTFIGGHR